MPENYRPENITLLLAKAAADTLTPAERQILDIWKESSTENSELYARLTDPQYLSSHLTMLDRIDTESASARMTALIEADSLTRELQASKRTSLRRWRTLLAAGISTAAVVAVLLFFSKGNVSVDHTPVAAETRIETGSAGQRILLTLDDGSMVALDTLSSVIGQSGALLSLTGDALVYDLDDGSSNEVSDQVVYNEIYVTRGKALDIMLSDGTKVWLNADSKLRFPVRFSGGERCVTLEGEAYFDVAPNNQMPFVVENQRQRVEVLSTEFNVYAYSGEPQHVTLVDGRVNVSGEGYESRLTPGQQLIAYADGTTQIRNVDTRDYVSWKEGYMLLDNKTLDEIIRSVNRLFDIDIKYDPQTLSVKKLHGRIPLSLSLDDTLAIISHSSGLRFYNDSGEIRIR